MATIQKEVAVSKETSEIMDLLVALVKGIKAKKSIATIMGEEFLEFVKALEGALEVPSEYEANKAASLKAILLGASDLVDALLGKAPEASDPAQLAMEDLTK